MHQQGPARRGERHQPEPQRCILLLMCLQVLPAHLQSVFVLYRHMQHKSNVNVLEIQDGALHELLASIACTCSAACSQAQWLSHLQPCCLACAERPYACINTWCYIPQLNGNAKLVVFLRCVAARAARLRTSARTSCPSIARQSHSKQPWPLQPGCPPTAT